MKIPDCPECGSLMKIGSLGANRIYECSSNSFLKKDQGKYYESRFKKT